VAVDAPLSLSQPPAVAHHAMTTANAMLRFMRVVKVCMVVCALAAIGSAGQ
jgi:hypothetical protein